MVRTHCFVFDDRHRGRDDPELLMKQFGERHGFTLLRVRLVQGAYVGDFNKVERAYGIQA